MWFVRALAEAGRDLAAVRQTLYRMEAEGELLTRRAGRVKFYRATGVADAEIETGLAKIFQPSSAAWDGQWTMVHLSLRGPAHRVARERVVSLLAVQGFASIGDEVYLHPRDVGVDLAGAIGAQVRSRVIIVRGPLTNPTATPTILAHWRVPALNQRYRRVGVRLAEVERVLERSVSDRDAFLLRFAVVFDFLGVAWDDPDLPPAALPADWQGHAVRDLAARLYHRLVEPATRHADRLFDRTPSPARSR
jgi:phenylacetic acid degradation operon negative regulatory protein